MIIANSIVTGATVNINLKHSDLNNDNQYGLVGLGVATMLGMFGLAGARRKRN